MKRYIYLICIGVCLATTSAIPLNLQAQNSQSKDTTMNRTVVVEQEYSPIITDASKINVLPKVEEPSVTKKEVEYATASSPAISIPSYPMRPYVGKEMQSNIKRGFIRAGYGNYGNLDLMANYLFHLSDKDNLDVYFQMDGMDGKLTMPQDEVKWNSYYYRTRATISYTHQFDQADLNIAGNFGLSNFNLSPYEPGKQKFTSGDIHVGVRSTNESYPLQFKAETNLMMFDRQNNNTPLFNSAISETQIHTKGIVSGAINDEQGMHIGLDMYNLFYNKNLTFTDNTKVYENRTSINLNPYYELSSDKWNLHIGANVDFSLGSGKSFRVSPDLVAQYIFSESYVLFAQATGGKSVNDFRRMESLCPYLLPDNTILDTYEQINAKAGFKASPYPGLRLNLFGGYQDLKDEPFETYGLKYEELNNRPEENDLTEINAARYLNLSFTHAHNIYAGLQVDYAYKDFLSFSLGGVYRHWDAKTEYALLLKPLYELKFDADFSPIAHLRIGVGYDYTGRDKIEGIGKMSAISNLHAGAYYTLFEGINVYGKINNILNKKYQYYLGYPTEGFNFLGGLSFSF